MPATADHCGTWTAGLFVLGLAAGALAATAALVAWAWRA